MVRLTFKKLSDGVEIGRKRTLDGSFSKALSRAQIDGIRRGRHGQRAGAAASTARCCGKGI